MLKAKIDFVDRTKNDHLYHVGDVVEESNPERAKRLVKDGFCIEVKENTKDKTKAVK